MLYEVITHLAVEEAYLLATYIRSLDEGALLAVGPVPVEGQHRTLAAEQARHLGQQLGPLV